MNSILLIIIIPLIISAGLTFAGWGWNEMPRMGRLICRTLSVWCLLIIPVLVFLNWICKHNLLIGYITLPFIIIAIVFFWERIPIGIKLGRKETKLTEKPTLQDIEARGAFLRAIKAITEKLVKNVCSTHAPPYILQQIFSELQIKPNEHILIIQDRKLLKEEFSRIDVAVRDFEQKINKLQFITTSKEVGEICREITSLTSSYRVMVKNLLTFIDGLKQEPIWENLMLPKIGDTLSSNFNELMKLTKELRKDTPESSQSILADENSLGSFENIPRGKSSYFD